MVSTASTQVRNPASTTAIGFQGDPGIVVWAKAPPGGQGSIMLACQMMSKECIGSGGGGGPGGVFSFSTMATRCPAVTAMSCIAR
jgi:hypothetical protein